MRDAIRRLDDGGPRRWMVAGVFAFALVVRLWFALAVHRPADFVFSDMWVYDLRARHLLSGELGPWDSFTPVGYPALLALLYGVSGRSLALVGVVQAVLGAATASIALLLAWRLTRSTLLALATGVLVAVHLPMVLYGGLLLAETAFAFGVALSAWLLLRAAEVPGWRRVVPAGLALAASTTIRPNLLLFFPLLPLWSWLATEKGPAWARANVAFAGRIFACALPVLAIAAAHNSRLVGKPTGLGTNGGLNFFLAHAPVKGADYREGGFTHQIYPIPNLARHQEVHVSTVPFYDEGHFYGLALREIAARPGRLLASLDNLVEGAGIGRQSFWPGWKGRDGLLRSYSRWFFWLGILPALAGAAVAFRVGGVRGSRQGTRLLMVALVLSAAGTLYAFLGDPRMRVPFDPLLIALALEAWAAALGWARRGVPGAGPVQAGGTPGSTAA
ncbi:MAG TPA: hypothetical protein VGD74_01025 [Vulgatibacter sp.]